MVFTAGLHDHPALKVCRKPADNNAWAVCLAQLGFLIGR